VNGYSQQPPGARGYNDHTLIDGKNRDELVASFTPRISAMARRLMARLPRDAAVELDDLFNSGALGLLDAMNRYDPERDVQFSTFADFRIRGAMLDVLRRVDPISRQARSTANRVQSVIAALEQRLGRPPEPPEVAEELGLSLETYWRTVNECRSVMLVSFEGRTNQQSRSLSDLLSDPSAATVEESVALRQALVSMREAIDKHLTKRQKTVVALYYLKNLTLKEIGAVLGVTESRISQIHTEACMRLRAHMAPELANQPAASKRKAKR